MAVILKLNENDADLLQRTIMALAAKPEACDSVLLLAGVLRAGQGDAVTTLVRIGNYIETVAKAG